MYEPHAVNTNGLTFQDAEALQRGAVCHQICSVFSNQPDFFVISCWIGGGGQRGHQLQLLLAIFWDKCYYVFSSIVEEIWVLDFNYLIPSCITFILCWYSYFSVFLFSTLLFIDFRLFHFWNMQHSPLFWTTPIIYEGLFISNIQWL